MSADLLTDAQIFDMMQHQQLCYISNTETLVAHHDFAVLSNLDNKAEEKCLQRLLRQNAEHHALKCALEELLMHRQKATTRLKEVEAVLEQLPYKHEEWTTPRCEEEHLRARLRRNAI